MSRRNEDMELSVTITSISKNTNKWNRQDHQGRIEEIGPSLLNWVPLHTIYTSINNIVLYSRQSEQSLNVFADDVEQLEERWYLRRTVNVEASRSTIITIDNSVCDSLIYAPIDSS